MKTSFNIRDDIHDMLKTLASLHHRSLTKETEVIIMKAYGREMGIEEVPSSNGKDKK